MQFEVINNSIFTCIHFALQELSGIVCKLRKLWAFNGCVNYLNLHRNIKEAYGNAACIVGKDFVIMKLS